MRLMWQLVCGCGVAKVQHHHGDGGWVGWLLACVSLSFEGKHDHAPIEAFQFSSKYS